MDSNEGQQQHDDAATPAPVKHNDDKRSDMPERDDKSRHQAPSDHPGKTPGEGETPVG